MRHTITITGVFWSLLSGVAALLTLAASGAPMATPVAPPPPAADVVAVVATVAPTAPKPPPVPASADIVPTGTAPIDAPATIPATTIAILPVTDTPPAATTQPATVTPPTAGTIPPVPGTPAATAPPTLESTSTLVATAPAADIAPTALPGTPTAADITLRLDHAAFTPVDPMDIPAHSTGTITFAYTGAPAAGGWAIDLTFDDFIPAEPGQPVPATNLSLAGVSGSGPVTGSQADGVITLTFAPGAAQPADGTIIVTVRLAVPDPVAGAVYRSRVTATVVSPSVLPEPSEGR